MNIKKEEENNGVKLSKTFVEVVNNKVYKSQCSFKIKKYNKYLEVDINLESEGDEEDNEDNEDKEDNENIDKTNLLKRKEKNFSLK